MKKCSKCKETHPMGDFYADKRNRDGKQSNCKFCCRALTEKWTKANPERARATSLKSAKAWYDQNPQRVKDRVSAWGKENPSRVAAARKKNKVKRNSRDAPWADSPMMAAFYLARDLLNNLSDGAVLYEVDHVVPLNGKNVCGLHVETNLEVVTQDYNRRKSNKHP